jgi:hypothetical protein
VRRTTAQALGQNPYRGAKEKLHNVQEKTCKQLHTVQCEGMNSNLLIGTTLKSRKQLARDAVRALNSARINLAQAIRWNMASAARDEAAVKECEQAVAYWKSEGVL